MQIIISVAMSLDGYIDDCTATRLKLSSKQDFYAVHELRARCDAIFVGAGTIRADNPSLTTKHLEFIQMRQKQQLPPDPIKVTLTRSNELDFGGKFFTTGQNDKYVFYTPTSFFDNKKKHIMTENNMIKFLPLPPPDAPAKDEENKVNHGIEYMLATLQKRNINTLLIEGGSEILTYMLSHQLAHQLRLAIAPVFVGDDRAPRFVKNADFKHVLSAHNKPVKVNILGDTTVIWYELKQ